MSIGETGPWEERTRRPALELLAASVLFGGAALAILFSLFGGYVVLAPLAVLLPVTGLVLIALALPKGMRAFQVLLDQPRVLPAVLPARPAATPADAKRDDELISALQAMDILKGLNREQVARVAALGHFAEMPREQPLASQGHYGDLLYFVLSGQVELATRSTVGEITVRVAGPGECVPLAPLLGAGELITNARSMTPLTTVVVRRDKMIELCYADPEIGMRVYHAVADILGTRYRKTLAHLSRTLDEALHQSDLFANV